MSGMLKYMKATWGYESMFIYKDVTNGLKLFIQCFITATNLHMNIGNLAPKFPMHAYNIA